MIRTEWEETLDELVARTHVKLVERTTFDLDELRSALEEELKKPNGARIQQLRFELACLGEQMAYDQSGFPAGGTQGVPYNPGIEATKIAQELAQLSGESERLEMSVFGAMVNEHLDDNVRKPYEPKFRWPGNRSLIYEIKKLEARQKDR